MPLTKLNKYQKLLLKGIIGTPSSSIYYYFKTLGKFNVEGNIFSLYYPNNFIEQQTIDTVDKFRRLFFGCTKLNSVINLILPATTLANYCYEGMFYGCESLIDTPKLPATTLAWHCYDQMFYGCKSITYGPELPATTLASSCYYKMFYNCTNLISAPELPATTLIEYCYECMFYGCKSLTTAPKLLATTLVNGCYNQMFNNCSSLSNIICLATNIMSGSNYTYHWLHNVHRTGIFIKDPNIIWPSGEDGIPTNWGLSIQFNPTINLLNNSCITCISTKGTSYIGLTQLSPYQTIYISKDNYHWMNLSYTLPVGLIEINENEELYIYGILSSNNTNSTYTNFTIIGSIELSGNINYLFNENEQMFDYAAFKLFSGCVGLVSIKNLEFPNINLNQYCYNEMFSGCQNLVIGPSILPSTTLADNCYQNMFYGCQSLTMAPELPATTLTSYCYNNMFNGCTNLNYIKCLAIDKSITDTLSWVDGVSKKGIFIGNPNSQWVYGISDIPNGWKTNVQIFEGYQSNNTLRIWVDDFPDRDEIADSQGQSWTDYISDVISDIKNNSDDWGANPYEYTGNTLIWEKTNGQSITGYIWVLLDEYIYTEATKKYVKYLLTDTIDFNILKSRSLEYDETNTGGILCILNDDLTTYKVPNINSTDCIIMINCIGYKSNNTLRIWIDDFPDRFDMATEYGYNSWSDFVDGEFNEISESDLEAMGVNPYEYTGQTFIWDDDEYYIWVRPDEFDSIVHDDGKNVKYLLTDTINYNTLYHRSLVYNSDNRGGIVCFLSNDLSTYNIVDDQSDGADSIITVVELN